MSPVVRTLKTDDEILAARAVMRQLRPQIPETTYLETVRRMMQTDGYLQAAVFDGSTVVAVAGYRFMEIRTKDKEYSGRLISLSQKFGARIRIDKAITSMITCSARASA